MKNSELMIQVENVRHRYGQRWALAGVDMQVGRGEIFALAGPNGSGKTTLLKGLAGLLRMTDGRISVLRKDPFRQRVAVMRGSRFAFAPPPLYESLTAYEHLLYLSAIGVSRRDRPDQFEFERVLKMVGLHDRSDDRVKTYSFGMRQRLALAMSLLPMPRLLVLDEPTDGLDPLAILELRDILRRLRDEQGLTLVLSSHLLVELENLADQLLVLQEGRVIYSGTPQAMLDTDARLVITVEGDVRKAQQVLQQAGKPCQLEANDILSLTADQLTLEQLRGILHRSGIELTSFHRSRPTLETALLKRLRQEQAAPSPGETNALDL